MSVAFRRESDDEHKEPRFELPLPPGPNLVTPNGLALIEAKLAELEARVSALDTGEVEAPPVPGAPMTPIEEARRDLRYWRTRHATAQLAPPPPEDEVAFGSWVRFRRDGRVKRIEIVGDDEADPAAGRIAFSAPLARALMGGYVGDLVDFGGKADAIEILEIGAIGG